MSAKGYLTAPEYKAIRQTLGFTQEEVAEFHHCRNLRTIRRWERGDSQVSLIACDKITALLEQINRIISAAVEQAEEQARQHADFEVVLLIYPDSCYRQYAYGFAELPNNIHRTMIFRTYQSLRVLGIKCGIVEFEPQFYFTYLAAHGLKDSPAARAEWAAQYHSTLLN